MDAMDKDGRQSLISMKSSHLKCVTSYLVMIRFPLNITALTGRAMLAILKPIGMCKSLPISSTHDDGNVISAENMPINRDGYQVINYAVKRGKFTLCVNIDR